MNNVEEALNAMDTQELMQTLEDILSNPDYKKSNYTAPMKDILQKYANKYTLTSSQVAFVQAHLKFNSKLWY